MDSKRKIFDEENKQLITTSVNTVPENHWLSTASQFMLGGIGVAAGVLYLGPAQTCALNKDCGLWLTQVTSKMTAIVIFTAGGADYAAGNILFGGRSGKEFYDYIQAEPNILKKLGKSGAVVIFTATQMVPLLLASLTVSTAYWQTILTVLGAIPGSLYGAISILKNDIPYLMSQAGVLASHLHHDVVSAFCDYSENEKRQWAVIIQYRKQQFEFIERVNARWRNVIANIPSTEIDNAKDKLEFLFQGDEPKSDSSWLASGVHLFGSLTGFLLTLNFSVGGVLNTFNLLTKYIPTLPLQAASMLFFNASLLYANFKLTIDGVTMLLDSMVDIVRGKPINLAIFQLRPKTTLFIGALSLAFSALSYAVIATLYLEQFKENKSSPQLEATRKGFLYGAMTGIDIYHFASLFHLYRLLFAALTPNQKEQFIFALEEEVNRLNNMSEEEFKEFIENNSVEKNALLGLQEFTLPRTEDEIHFADDEVESESDSNLDTVVSFPSYESTAKFRVFGGKTINEEERVEEVLEDKARCVIL